MAVNMELISRVLKHGEEHSPFRLGVGHDENGWLIGYKFGQESEDSPMYGGAAYGGDDDFEIAMGQVLKDLRLDA